MNKKPSTPGKPKLEVNTAVRKIQKAWRSYTNHKVYKYYRDLILFKTGGNPTDLLKTFNPGEAALIDNSSNAHVRFRLGGDRFPPTIYYKIYVHRAVVDINSFAPRDYSTIKKGDLEKEEKKIYYNEYKEKKIYHDGWYLRFENNGWRPLTHAHSKKKDYVELATSNKVKYFHYNKDFRKQKNDKQKRLNKIRWLHKMYEKAKLEEEMLKNQPNPFEDAKLIDIDDENFDKEARELLEWSENLDFDKYYEDWIKMSTSQKSETFGASKTQDLYSS